MGECYLHTVEVASSSLAFPTIGALSREPFFVMEVLIWENCLAQMVSEELQIRN